MDFKNFESICLAELEIKSKKKWFLILFLPVVIIYWVIDCPILIFKNAIIFSEVFKEWWRKAKW